MGRLIALRDDRDPVELVLLALRERFGAAAYRCDERSPDIWHARCPACAGLTTKPFPLRVTRSGLLRCETGCDSELVGNVLADRVGEPAADVVDATGPSDGSALADRLAASAVDLIDLIEHGVPERAFVPGAEGLLVAGKRHLVAGDAKAGKSLALGVVQALAIVEAGGRVVIIDRENGADEVAGRLRDALADRDPQVRGEWQQRARYFAWPALTLDDGPALAAALGGTDLVIFDSSRMVTAALGLAEDSSDDYARFVAALIQPLSHAGIATLILDNAGHDEKQRARGSSAKADLNEVVFTLKTIREFDRRISGEIELRRTHARFAEVRPLWRMRIGGGVYEPFTPTRALPDPVETAILQAVEAEPGIGREHAAKAGGGKLAAARSAVDKLIQHGVIERRNVPHEDAAGRSITRPGLYLRSTSHIDTSSPNGTNRDEASPRATDDASSPRRVPPEGGTLGTTCRAPDPETDATATSERQATEEEEVLLERHRDLERGEA